METIHHIKTGGTIGGCVPEYPEIEVLAGIFPDTVDLDKYLIQSLKMFAGYTEKLVCHKDSRQITEEDRGEILESVKQEYEKGTKKFLISHGTYTMPETGKFLEENLSVEIKENSQIIITGSMFPWTVLGSDAPINLGAALGILLNTSVPQISICMHAKLFNSYKVDKDADNLIFKEA